MRYFCCKQQLRDPPNLPSADSIYLAGLKRLGEALQDGMSRFAMTISSTFGPQASSAAVVYIWLSFYLRRSIPLLLDASASPAVISLHSAVIGPLAQAAAISPNWTVRGWSARSVRDLLT